MFFLRGECIFSSAECAHDSGRDKPNLLFVLCRCAFSYKETGVSYKETDIFPAKHELIKLPNYQVVCLVYQGVVDRSKIYLGRSDVVVPESI